jgi:uncharacterized membrane protein
MLGRQMGLDRRQRWSATPEDEPSDERMTRLSDTSRVEAFSDGVFAIVITLLVLDLRVPNVGPGHLVTGLLQQWPAYLAYVTSFLYVGILWQNHHSTFHRIRYMDRGAHWANLGVLFTAALLPFPTAVLSYAIQDGSATDGRVATALYALVGALLCTSWFLFFLYLDAHPELLEDDVEEGFLRQECVRALTGVVGYVLAGLAGYLVTPVAALVIFFVLPAFYGITSQGLSELHEVMAGRPRRRRSTPSRSRSDQG